MQGTDTYQKKYLLAIGSKFFLKNLNYTEWGLNPRGLRQQSLSLPPWTTRASVPFFFIIFLHGTRFELARYKPSDLESDPLDQTRAPMQRLKKFDYPVRGSNPRPHG